MVLLRTRPALNFFTSVTYYTKVKGSFQRTNYLNANAKSFQIKICLRLKGKALEASKARLRKCINMKRRLWIRNLIKFYSSPGLLVTLSMDTQQSGNPRFTFAQRESKTTFHLDVDALSFTNCKSLLANLQQVCKLAFERKILPTNGNFLIVGTTATGGSFNSAHSLRHANKIRGWGVERQA